MEHKILTPEQIKQVKGLGCLQDKRYTDVFNVRTITQGPEELNIIVGVDGDEFEKAVSAIWILSFLTGKKTIYVGQKLRIPVAAAAPAKTVKKDAKKTVAKKNNFSSGSTSDQDQNLP